MDDYTENPYWSGPLGGGAGSTIGLQKDSTTYNQYAFNTNHSIQPEQIIRFTPNGSGGYNVNSAASPINDLIYLTIPSASSPSLVSPADESTVDVDTSFSWDAAVNATGYILNVSENSDMSYPVISDNGIGATSVTPNILLSGGLTYYWNVRAFNNVGETKSQTYNFATTNAGSVIYLSTSGSASLEVAASTALIGIVEFLAIDGSSSVSLSSDSPLYGLVSSPSSLYTVADNTGRGARIDLSIDGYLEITAQLEDNQDRFVMIKRVSPIMPNPLPLNSRGEPT